MYTGSSIVDYLNSVGKASDYASRAALAATHGITGYSGTADQNTQLLTYLRSSGGNSAPTTPTTPAAPTTPAPTGGTISIPGVGEVPASDAAKYGYTAPASTPAAPASTAPAPSTDPSAYRNPDGTLHDAPNGGSYSSTAGPGAISVGGGVYYIPNPNYVPPAAPAAPAAPTAPAPTAPAPTVPTTTTPPGAVPPVVPPVIPPVIPPTTPTAPAGGAPSSYTGPSVVDYLNSVGSPSDYASRARLAASMGITGYTGTSSQNTQLLNSLRSAGAGNNSSTAVAGANAAGNKASTVTPPATAAPGSPGTPAAPANDGTDAASIIANATAIAKSFGWIAPDPNNSPLNIATNLFTQGLAAFGLTNIQTQINNTLQQSTDLQNAKADEAATINANPWLTEGERVARLSKLDDKYATKLDILTHQQQLYEADYKTGLDQVQWQVGQAMSAYNTAETANEKLFSDALSVAQNVMNANVTLKKDNAAAAEAANKPVEVNPGNSLVNPTTGQVIYTAPSKAVSTLSTSATNDAAVRAGVDISTFQTYPADVQAYFSQTKDGDQNLLNIKSSLTDVANGKKKAQDFVTSMNNGDFGTLAPAVKSFLSDQASQAEKIAPPLGQKGPSVWWNPLTW